jgi:hypothetical protein
MSLFLIGLALGCLIGGLLRGGGRRRHPDDASIDAHERARQALRRYGPPGA